MAPTQKSTIDDVADMAGVSIKTVSRVVNNEPNVRPATREKVEKAIRKLNYRPNLSARNLASHRSHVIILVYEDPSSYEIPSSGYVVRLQQGALRACKATHCELLIHPCNFRDKNVGEELTSLIEYSRPVGVVLAAPLSNMSIFVDAIASTGVPFARLSPGEPNGKQLAVVTNDRGISAEMTRYLASLGHRRIAFIAGNPDHKAVSHRLEGFRDGMQESGLDTDEALIVVGDNSFGSGENSGRHLLELANPPTAIFAANDDMAAGVLRQAVSMGIKVPEQLSIAGCDDISLARQMSPALTTIRQPLSSMSERAALALVREAREKKPSTGTELINASLRIRDSTGPAPTG